MKKMFAVVLLAVLALVPACGDDDESIVGAWVTTLTDGSKSEVTFTATTYEMLSFDETGVKVDGEKGTYTYTGSSISFTETHHMDDNLAWVASSEVETGTYTCSLSDGKMTITTPKGTFVYTKK